MISLHRVAAVATAPAAALGAGAVVSSAQSSSVIPSPGSLADQCARTLPTPAGDAPPAFLKIDGIDGESRNARHAGEIDVDSFRFGAFAPGTAKPAARTLVVGKPYDKASPQALDRLAKGAHISTVVLSQDKAGGTFQRYTLSDVTIVDEEHTGRVRVNSERLCLRFARADVEYRPQSPDGSLGEAIKATL